MGWGVSPGLKHPIGGADAGLTGTLISNYPLAQTFAVHDIWDQGPMNQRIFCNVFRNYMRLTAFCFDCISTTFRPRALLRNEILQGWHAWLVCRSSGCLVYSCGIFVCDLNRKLYCCRTVMDIMTERRRGCCAHMLMTWAIGHWSHGIFSSKWRCSTQAFRPANWRRGRSIISTTWF